MGNKVVINSCYGGFGLSEAAKRLFNRIEVDRKIPVTVWDEIWVGDIPRHHPILIQVVELLGDAAGDDYSSLEVVEITGNQYRISEYDGYESVQTPENMMWTLID